MNKRNLGFFRIDSETDKLKQSQSALFNEKYPIWKCPTCGHLNEFINTFGEICENCKTNHTLDWQNYIVKNHA